MIASFHIVHFNRRYFRQRKKKPDRVDGLQFWKPLSIGPDFKSLPHGFSRWDLAKPNFRRWAFLGVWEDDAAVDAFLDGSVIAQQWQDHAQEVWHVRLKPKRTSGTWHGANPIEKYDGASLPTGPWATISRGELRLHKAHTFWLETARVAVSDVLQVPGFLAGIALVEMPLVEVMTFTLWDSSENVMNFARKRPAHASLIERDKNEHLFRGFFYGHFYPYASEGSWFGENPLAEVPSSDSSVGVQRSEWPCTN